MDKYIKSYPLVDSVIGLTGSTVDVSNAQYGTIYYNFEGGGTANLKVEAQDENGNWGYTVYQKGYSGVAAKNIIKYRGTLSHGVRGVLSQISGANAQIFLDSLYETDERPVLLFYDNNLVLENQPTPIVSKVDNYIRYGERWAEQSTITLHGQLTGCDYISIISAQQKLLNAFGRDYQKFSIVQDGFAYEQKYNVIKNVNFEQSNYWGMLNYTIALESYPQDMFSGYYGVLNPVNEWQYTESEDRLLEITHTIGAKGFNTSAANSNAFNNAKKYVLGQTGLSSFITPFYTSICSGLVPCLDSFSESINRFNGTYHVTEKYIADLYNGNNAIIRYAANYDCDINKGISTVSVQGEVKSDKNSDLSTLRNKYSTFDLYSAAVQTYNDATTKTDLNPYYISSGIHEDNYSKKVTFNVSFDNIFTPRTYFDYTSDVKIDENDITTVDIKGVIKARGDLNTRWQLVQSFYTQELNLYGLAIQSYSDFGGTYSLNPRQQTYSTVKNPFIGQIEVSTSYNNKDVLPDGIKFLNYTLEYKPALEVIKSTPLVNIGGSSLCSGQYSTIDLGYKSRAAFAIKGNIVGESNVNYAQTLSGVKQIINSNFLQNFSNNRVFLDKQQFSQDNHGYNNEINFDCSWSFDSYNNAIVYPYNFLNNLSL